MKLTDALNLALLEILIPTAIRINGNAHNGSNRDCLASENTKVLDKLSGKSGEVFCHIPSNNFFVTGHNEKTCFYDVAVAVALPYAASYGRWLHVIFPAGRVFRVGGF